MGEIPTKLERFEERIDSWVITAVENGTTQFGQLLVSLPGVYPSLVLDSVRRLSLNGRIPLQVLDNTLVTHDSGLIQHEENRHILPLPIPHPLDFDWRFTSTSTKKLLDLSLSISRSDELIALLGTPSLFRHAAEQHYPRPIVLLDKKDGMFQFWPTLGVNAQIITCDLLSDEVPDIEANVVITDPPWYEEYTHIFLWIGTRICKMNGHLLLSTPQIGTRPSIEEEWDRTLSWTKELGLTLVQFQQGVLAYESPHFEKNALTSEGIHGVPIDWRRANLAVFTRSRYTEIIRPASPQSGDDWMEVQFPGTRIRVRQSGRAQFLDPSLVSIVPNDILPSVSRRDTRRRLVDVWTSGNRVFACRGCWTLGQILKALMENQRPAHLVASELGRELNAIELVLVSDAVEQLTKLISVEREEYLGVEYDA